MRLSVKWTPRTARIMVSYDIFIPLATNVGVFHPCLAIHGLPRCWDAGIIWMQPITGTPVTGIPWCHQTCWTRHGFSMDFPIRKQDPPSSQDVPASQLPSFPTRSPWSLGKWCYPLFRRHLRSNGLETNEDRRDRRHRLGALSYGPLGSSCRFLGLK